MSLFTKHLFRLELKLLYHHFQRQGSSKEPAIFSRLYSKVANIVILGDKSLPEFTTSAVLGKKILTRLEHTGKVEYVFNR